MIILFMFKGLQYLHEFTMCFPGGNNSPSGMLDYLRETGKYCHEEEKKAQRDGKYLLSRVAYFIL